MTEREKVIKGLQGLYGSKETIELIADAIELLKEQKHGHWKDDKYGNMLCSACGGLAIVSMTGCLVDRHLAPYLSDYCPHCGAKMDGEVNHDV